jgi:hypothetical protein
VLCYLKISALETSILCFCANLQRGNKTTAIQLRLSHCLDLRCKIDCMWNDYRQTVGILDIVIQITYKLKFVLAKTIHIYGQNLPLLVLIFSYSTFPFPFTPCVSYMFNFLRLNPSSHLSLNSFKAISSSTTYVMGNCNRRTGSTTTRFPSIH